jgi:hypothetical protein
MFVYHALTTTVKPVMAATILPFLQTLLGDLPLSFRLQRHDDRSASATAGGDKLEQNAGHGGNGDEWDVGPKSNIPDKLSECVAHEVCKQVMP